MRKSTIPDAGNGLFATRDFAKGELVTEYAGRSMRDQFVAAECKVQTHIAHVSASRQRQLGLDPYIYGDHNPIPGRGGGSFANHSSTKSRTVDTGRQVIFASTCTNHM